MTGSALKWDDRGTKPILSSAERLRWRLVATALGSPVVRPGTGRWQDRRDSGQPQKPGWPGARPPRRAPLSLVDEAGSETCVRVRLTRVAPRAFRRQPSARRHADPQRKAAACAAHLVHRATAKGPSGPWFEVLEPLPRAPRAARGPQPHATACPQAASAPSSLAPSSLHKHQVTPDPPSLSPPNEMVAQRLALHRRPFPT